MDNQEYNRIEKTISRAGYLKFASGGALVTSLINGYDLAAGICFGLYLIGDIIDRNSRTKLNDHLRSGLEDALKK